MSENCINNVSAKHLYQSKNETNDTSRFPRFFASNQSVYVCDSHRSWLIYCMPYNYLMKTWKSLCLKIILKKGGRQSPAHSLVQANRHSTRCFHFCGFETPLD